MENDPEDGRSRKLTGSAETFRISPRESETPSSRTPEILPISAKENNSPNSLNNFEVWNALEIPRTKMQTFVVARIRGK